jgi:3'(2'), 5'-bisphosphate nucleotidase
MLNSKEADFAIEAVRRAAHLARHIQQEMVTPALTKQDRSPVTVADFAAQAVIGYLLGDAFPQDAMVGEEHSGQLRDPVQREALERVTEFVAQVVPSASPASVCTWIDRGAGNPHGRFWTLDPIDGTKGFLRGEQYAVALALIEGGQVRLGVLGCPNLTDGYRQDFGGPGSILVAARGEGAWVSPLEGGSATRLYVSDRANPVDARVLRSVESGHTDVAAMGQLVATLGTRAEPVLMDSQAKYAVLAAGHGELYFRLLSPEKPNYREKIWDQAAGSIIIEEAGGRVSDLEGRPLDFTHGRTLAANRGLVASNGHLHEAAVAAARQVHA